LHFEVWGSTYYDPVEPWELEHRSVAWVRPSCALHTAQEEHIAMIDHTGVAVSDPTKSRAFYEQALAPLGYKLLMEIPKQFTGGKVVLGFGEPDKPDFWINEGTPQTPPIHVAFRAKTRAEVDAFYKAALAAGGRDNGAPGPRPHYHPNYYGAFVLDPDGHNIEAVCHTP
jgi:catechol 2,3-dioxygenase-like lactoylglutathione lyase family enzyme